MSNLEMQLRSWAPRRPSARLERRLFARPPAPAPVAERRTPDTDSTAAHFRLSWLAPATLALLLMCVLVNQRNLPGSSPAANSGPIVALELSNQSAAAWLPGSFAHDQNSVPAETFEWTNGSRSSARPGSVLKPNRH
jgi:hypothetical protein